MTLQDDISSVLNHHAAESGSNTPDFILARFLTRCLTAYDEAVRERSVWYGRMDQPGAGGLDGAPMLGEISDDGPGTYQGVPTAIEAIRWLGDNYSDLRQHVGEKVRLADSTYEMDDVTYHNLELLAGADGAQEWVPVPVGHWLVHKPGDRSDVWPVKNAYFRAKYKEILR